MTTCTVSPLLAENVGTGCGENAYKCYQCKTLHQRLPGGAATPTCTPR